MQVLPDDQRVDFSPPRLEISLDNDPTPRDYIRFRIKDVTTLSHRSTAAQRLKSRFISRRGVTQLS